MSRNLIPVGLLASMFVAFTVSDLHADEKIPLRVGFHLEKGRLETAYSEQDVMLATEVLFNKVLTRGAGFDAEFKVFRSESRFLEAVVAGELDYVEVSPLMWLQLPEEQRALIDPISVVQLGEKRLDRFVLLAPPGATLEGLAGKRLRSADRGEGIVWTNYELQKAGFPEMSEHFDELQEVKNPNDVLIPTFFGKADACVVREDDYLVASELNPQIAKRLVPLKTSPELPLILMALVGSDKDEIRKRLGGGAPKDILAPASAQQALALLRIKNVTAFKKGDIDAFAKIVDAMKAPSVLTAVEETEEED